MAQTSSVEPLKVERVLKATREKVFKAFTSEQELREWYIPCEAGFKLSVYEVNAKVGGKYRIEILSPEKRKDVLSGVYEEVKAPERIVYSMVLKEGRVARKGDTPMSKTRVCVSLKDLGAKTEVVITQEPFPMDKAKESQEKGWKALLDKLAKHLGS